MAPGEAWGFPGGSEVKLSAWNAGDLGSIPGQEDPLEKEMATHSSILAWRIPWMEEPGGLQSTGSQRVRHDWVTSLSLSFFLHIIGLKIYWAWPCPSEQGVVSPSVSLYYQETFISLLSLSISQNENHNYRKIIKLINWTTAFSSSVKPWAMPCRITQDRWVMVENSDKVWSTGEGNGKQL